MLNNFYVHRKHNDCPAKLISNTDENTFVSKGEHNHLIDIRDVEKKERLLHAKKQAVETGKTTRQIISDAYEGAEEEVLVQMPTGEKFARRLRSQRQKNSTIPNAPSTLDELQLVDIKTNKDEPFIMGDYTAGTNRIVMFSTGENLEFLGTCEQMHMDGTFSTCPDLFQQIYVIHGKLLSVSSFTNDISLLCCCKFN